MPKNITYLFGAGASANALPIVKQIPEKIKDLISKLENEFLLDDSLINGENITFKDAQKEMINDLNWLYNASDNHASVDTYAKKLFITQNSDDLKKLKLVLSLFFVIEEIDKKPDVRYDTFFASILNSVHDFPENVDILSWNYDTQFEIAYSEYSNIYEIDKNKKKLGILNKSELSYRSFKQFNIFKINGSIGFHGDGGRVNFYLNNTINSEVNIDFIKFLTEQYFTFKYKEKAISYLSFAWEYDSHVGIVKKIKEKTKNNEILVVIGYSFPFFNRVIDKEIINNMVNLEKVYFQSPKSRNLIERFGAISNYKEGIELIPINDLEQFYLPNEL